MMLYQSIYNMPLSLLQSSPRILRIIRMRPIISQHHSNVSSCYQRLMMIMMQSLMKSTHTACKPQNSSKAMMMLLFDTHSSAHHRPYRHQKQQSFSYSTTSMIKQYPSKEHSSAITPQNYNLNIFHLIPKTTLDTIQSLPEVKQLLSTISNDNAAATTTTVTTTTVATTLESINRSIQIFQHVGKEEHHAMLLLKSMYLFQIGCYDDSHTVLSSLLEENNENNWRKQYHITSSLAKICWYNGYFDQALEYATSSCYDNNNHNNISKDNNKSDSELSSLLLEFAKGCSLHSIAMCKLLLSSSPSTMTHKLKDIDILQILAHQHDKKQQDTTTSNFDDEIIEIKQLFQQQSISFHDAYVKLVNHNNGNNNNNNESNHNHDIVSKVQLALACAASYSNYGVVTLLYNIINNNNNDKDYKDCNTYDSAMKIWKDGLDILKQLEKDEKGEVEMEVKVEGDEQPRIKSLLSYNYLYKSIQARIYCNMAWTILFHSSYDFYAKMESISGGGKVSSSSPLKEEELKIASECARLALKCCDDISHIHPAVIESSYELKAMKCRALGLVASCYARAGSAVTAEGLLQSAMDIYKQQKDQQRYYQDNKNMKVNVNPMFQIDARSVHLYYSSLCSNWEKRDSDARLYEKIALEINNDTRLSDNWRDVSAIYSGLWFFTMSDFHIK